MEIIASGGYDCAVKLWDISSGDLLTILTDHISPVITVTFNPSGAFLATLSVDRNLIVWDCSSWTKISTFIEKTSIIVSFNFSWGADKIVIASMDGTVRVWNFQNKTEDMKIRISFLSAVAFNTSGDEIAAACDKSVSLYSSTTGELIRKFSDYFCLILSVEYDLDGNMLLSRSPDNTVVIWDNATGEVLRTLLGCHEAVMSQAKFNADASRVVTSSWDNTARVWDVDTGKCLLTLAGHVGILFSCCFSEDGSKVVTCSSDATIMVWDSHTGEELKTITGGHTSAVTTVSCRPSLVGSFV